MRLLSRTLRTSFALVLLASAAHSQCVTDEQTFGVINGVGRFFGDQVELDADGDTAIFADESDETNGFNAGAVNIWRHDGQSWTAEPKLIPPGNGPDDGYGRSAALDAAGDTLIVGEHDFSVAGQGRVYVYQNNGTSWVQEALLVASDAAQVCCFGTWSDLDASGTVAVITGEGGYVFRRVGTTWSEEQKLNGPAFGSCVISADGLTIAWSDRVFRYDGTQWLQQGTLVPSGGAPIMPISIDADGNTILVRQIDGAADQGPRVFRDHGNGWVEEQKLQPAVGMQSGETFATSIAMDSFAEKIFVGGRVVNPMPALEAEVTEYHFDGNSWAPVKQHVSSFPGTNLGGGIGLSADASVVVVGGNSVGPSNYTVYDFRCSSPATYCHGSACFCGNNGLPGRGCDNPAETGGVRLAASSFSPDLSGGGTVDLVSTGFPSMGSPAAVVIRSTTSNRLGTPLFDGQLCLQGSVTRIRSALASSGSAAFPLTHGAGAGTFHYQVLYRSLPLSFCDPSVAANLSNGLTLVWL
jgi:hypothetical protein